MLKSDLILFDAVHNVRQVGGTGLGAELDSEHVPHCDGIHRRPRVVGGDKCPTPCHDARARCLHVSHHRQRQQQQQQQQQRQEDGVANSQRSTSTTIPLISHVQVKSTCIVIVRLDAWGILATVLSPKSVRLIWSSHPPIPIPQFTWTTTPLSSHVQVKPICNVIVKLGE